MKFHLIVLELDVLVINIISQGAVVEHITLNLKKMNSSSFIIWTLIVGLVYLLSYVHSTPTDRTPDQKMTGFNIPTDRTPDMSHKPTDKTPAITEFRDLVSRGDSSMMNYLANTGNSLM